MNAPALALVRAPGSSRRTLAFRLAIAAWLCGAYPLRAFDDQGTPSEYEVKAAFLYNFAKFVEWPDGALSEGGPFVIAVLGADPFGDILDRTLAGKTVAERKLLVRRVASVEDAAGAHIVFISASEKARLGGIVKALEGRRVLTVGDVEGFAERGGMIGFKTAERKIRFDINVGQAARSQLKISSQLLKLARIVPGGMS